MTRIAIATCIDQPALTSDDERLGRALTSAGIDWSAVPWNDHGVDWTSFDGVLLRSTWDYHQQFDAFLDWITQIEAFGIPLWNDPDILRWNLDKNYLRDLEAAGIAVIPTCWVVRGSKNIDLPQIMDKNQWTDVVVKPSVSAGGRGLLRYNRDNAALAGSALAIASSQSDLLIQPFLREIKDGELSFVLFDGEISHVVRKTPQRGDYRVQAKFGGSLELATPTASIANEAVLAASIKGKQLYARIDGLEIDGRLVVMEVELVEPDLFLHLDPKAAPRFVAALKRLLAGMDGQAV